MSLQDNIPKKRQNESFQAIQFFVHSVFKSVTTLMKSSDLLFETYHPIMPYPDEFLRVAACPLPTTIWVNSLKITPKALRDSLEHDGVIVKPVSWTDRAFRVVSDVSMGVRWQFEAGYYHIQEEVSMLPVMALDPKPHEKVLDMCAAPGNKTSQIAIAMRNSGTLVANDRNYQRMRTLGQIVQRLGLINCHLTIYDAIHFPRVSNYFDKVLVDAPCSCEGTFRKSANKVVNPNIKKSKSLAKIQLALLRKAFKLCKTGGRILYSTCTFSPEENEKVVAQFLQEYQGQIRLVDIELPGFELTPGITTDKEVPLPDNLVKTKRIWPHLNNTGGFYYALLEKVSSYTSTIDSVHFESYESEHVKPLLQEQCDRFGIDINYFRHYQFATQSNRGIYIVNSETKIPDKLNYDSTGLFFIKVRLKHPKLSKAALELIYPQITKNKLELNTQQFDLYQSGDIIQLPAQQASLCDSTGYVVVTHQGRILPLGIYFSDYGAQGARLKKF